MTTDADSLIPGEASALCLPGVGYSGLGEVGEQEELTGQSTGILKTQPKGQLGLTSA